MSTPKRRRVVAGTCTWHARPGRGLPSPWEHSIRAFEARDRTTCGPVQGCIVFVGSSSFTLWSSLEEDMAPLPAVNRGFGGALIDDVVRYTDRIVVPYLSWPSCSSPAPTTSRGPACVGRLRS